MRNILNLAGIGMLAIAIGCSIEAEDGKDSRTQLNGTWGYVGPCAEIVGEPGSPWLTISNNDKAVVQCTEESGSYTTLKGVIVPTQNQGIYRIDWSNGTQSDASYPVRVKYLSVGSDCWQYMAGAQPPSGCAE